jgi:hypothetical protein
VTLLFVAPPAFAHRLDEYLQATTISVESGRIRAQVRLVPGVAVLPIVLRSIDRDADGVFSPAEQHAYAERVLRDLSLTIDGRSAPLRLLSSTASTVQEMEEGRGEIRLEVDAQVPPGGRSRRLVFENRHETRIAAYLVNCLVPSDSNIRIAAQDRSYDQSFYRLDYVEGEAPARMLSLADGSGTGGWLAAAAFVLLAWLASLLRRRAPRNDATEHG